MRLRIGRTGLPFDLDHVRTALYHGNRDGLGRRGVDVLTRCICRIPGIVLGSHAVRIAMMCLDTVIDVVRRRAIKSCDLSKRTVVYLTLHKNARILF